MRSEYPSSLPRVSIASVSDETWRPLGVDTDNQIAEYDALHDGVQPWMWAAYWAWVRASITVLRRYRDGSGPVSMLDTNLAEQMCQTLRIPLPNLRMVDVGGTAGANQLNKALEVLSSHPSPLQIADWLLAHGTHGEPDELDALLKRSKSAWQVGTRADRTALVRRVPLGVQVAADSVMTRAGRAGVRLAEAWGELYGPEPNASAAYRLAIQAVEDASIPVVSPTNKIATLGTVLQQIEDQKNWRLPMDREHEKAPTGEVVVGMMRMLWHGQHDRHGGQPSAPGNVSWHEAAVAVSLAVTLVDWFSSGLVRRG